MRTTTYLILAIILISCSSLVLAIGVSPAKETIIYGVDDPVFQFKPVLNPGETGSLTVSVSGDLKDYISLEYTDSTSTVIKGRVLQLPETLPGTHTQQIFIGLDTAGGGTIGAQAKVAAQLDIIIPRPEEFLTADFSISENPGSGSILATAMLQNLGTRGTTPHKTVLDISYDGREVAQLTFPVERVEPGEFSKVTSRHAELEQKGVFDGVLTVDFSKGTVTEEKEFSLGNPGLEITDLTYNDDQGTIKPVDIEGRIDWNRPVDLTISIIYDNKTEPALTETISAEDSFEHRMYLDTEQVGSPREKITVVISSKGSSVEAISELGTRITFDIGLPKWLEYTLLALAFLLTILVLKLLIRRQVSRN